MASSDAERQGDGRPPVHFGPGGGDSPRWRLLSALGRGTPLTDDVVDRDTLAAALLDVWQLTGRWARGGAVGRAAAAEARDAIGGLR